MNRYASNPTFLEEQGYVGVRNINDNNAYIRKMNAIA